MKLSFLLVFLCGVSLSTSDLNQMISNEFNKLDLQDTDFGNPRLKAAITYPLLALADFRNDAELSIAENPFNTNPIGMSVSGIFSILNLLSTSTDTTVEIGWEAYNATVKNCSDILTAYAYIRNKMYDRDVKAIKNVGSRRRRSKFGN